MTGDEGAGPTGVARPGPTHFSDENFSQLAADDTLPAMSLVSLDRHRHHFLCKNDNLGTRGQENVANALIWARLEEKGGLGTASSS